MTKKSRFFPILITMTTTAVLGYLYGEKWLRALLLYLSEAPWARTAVQQNPMAWPVASRFVAGETINEAILTTQSLNDQGLLVTLDYLGENVTNAQEASDAAATILQLLDEIHNTGVQGGISVKLSQLGLKLGNNIALNHMRALAARAQSYGNFIRIDMEESEVVDETLAIYRQLRQEGFGNVGVVIQSYLYRSQDDVAHLIEAGAAVRLVKGAYAEPGDVAFPIKADTDHNFVRLMQQMLSPTARENGVKLAVASHDEAIIQQAKSFMVQHNLPQDAFEFQMLFGVRRELQLALAQEGYRVRVYVPFGQAWYPYFVRRLAERPANLYFFLSNFFKQ